MNPFLFYISKGIGYHYWRMNNSRPDVFVCCFHDQLLKYLHMCKMSRLFFLLFLSISSTAKISPKHLSYLVTWEYRREFLADMIALQINDINTMIVGHQQEMETLKQFTGLSKEELLKQLQDYRSTTQFSETIGYINFVNIINFVAVFLIVSSVCAMFAVYILPIVLAGYPFILEIVAWVSCGVLIYLGLKIGQWIGLFISIAGCFGLIGSSFLTIGLHHDRNYGKEPPVKEFILLITVIWGFTAILHQSEIVGYMTIMALETFLGFIFISLPFCYIVGFDKNDAVPRAMGSSLIMIIVYCSTEVGHFDIGPFIYFKNAVLVCGTIVHFIGCLIISNQHYSESNYFLANIYAFSSCLVSIFFGSMFPALLSLQKIGGTFGALLITGKWTEFWTKGSYMLGTLALGIILYIFATISHLYPQCFIYSF
jgi:hypothetical protein